jgi:hypothetical protein
MFRALTAPGSVEIAWKSSVALMIAAAVMVGVAIYLPPPPPDFAFGVQFCLEDAEGACRADGAEAVGKAGVTLVQDGALISKVWAKVGPAGRAPSARELAGRGPVPRLNLLCSERTTVTAQISLSVSGERTDCPKTVEARPPRALHSLLMQMYGTNHYRFRLTCGFADGEEVIADDGAQCASSNRQPLTAVKVELRQNYLSILQDAGCKFSGMGCAPTDVPPR